MNSNITTVAVTDYSINSAPVNVSAIDGYALAGLS
jgi:hypothetical protein